MKPKFQNFLLTSSIGAWLAASVAQAATFTWSNLDNAIPVTNGNWSSGESWSAVPISAADTTLSFGYTFATNSAAETNTLTNDIANPFQLNVLTLGVATPTAGSGSSVALINIAGSPLDFVANGGLNPQVNLSQNRSNGQVVSFNVQSALVLSANTAFTGNGTANFTVSGGISGAGNFTKGGTSKLTLSGTNSYAGTTTISGGILQFTNAVSLYNNTPASWTAANISVANGATLGLNVGGTGFTATGVNTLVNNLGGANGSGTTGFAGGSTLALDTTGGGINVTANIVDSTGTGGGVLNVTKQGTNTLTLSGANTYTGTTTLNQGILALNPGVTAQTIGNISLAHVSGDMTFTLDGSSTANTAGNITQTGTTANGIRTFMNKSGTGTWTVGNMTGVGTSRIALTISGGTLSVGQIVSGVTVAISSSTGTLQLRTAGNQAIGGIGALAGTIDNSSGGLITFNVNPAITFTGAFTLAGSSLNMGTGTVALGATRQVTVSDTASTLTFGGVISGTGFGLTKAGAGTLKLGGANLYTGATTVNAGTLEIAAGGSTHASSAVTLSNSGTKLIVNGTVNGTLLANVSTTVSGSGTINGNADILGTISPGTSSTGETLRLGSNLTLGADAILAFGLGTTSDLIDFTTAANNLFGSGLAVLDLTLLSGFNYANTYTIFQDTTTTGFTLENITGYDTVNYTANFFESGDNYLVNFTAVPEPSSAALLGALGTLLLFRRRR